MGLIGLGIEFGGTLPTLNDFWVEKPWAAVEGQRLGLSLGPLCCPAVLGTVLIHQSSCPSEMDLGMLLPGFVAWTFGEGQAKHHVPGVEVQDPMILELSQSLVGEMELN